MPCNKNDNDCSNSNSTGNNNHNNKMKLLLFYLMFLALKHFVIIMKCTRDNCEAECNQSLIWCAHTQSTKISEASGPKTITCTLTQTDGEREWVREREIEAEKFEKNNRKTEKVVVDAREWKYSKLFPSMQIGTLSVNQINNCTHTHTAWSLLLVYWLVPHWCLRF